MKNIWSIQSICAALGCCRHNLLALGILAVITVMAKIIISKIVQIEIFQFKFDCPLIDKEDENNFPVCFLIGNVKVE
jgi:hypothetical protein